MKCHRCGSVMVYERFYGSDGHFLGWRCIQWGEMLDEVIAKIVGGDGQAEWGMKERRLVE